MEVSLFCVHDLLFLGCISTVPENLLCVINATFEPRPCSVRPAPCPRAAPSQFKLPYINLGEPWTRFLPSGRVCSWFWKLHSWVSSGMFPVAGALCYPLQLLTRVMAGVLGHGGLVTWWLSPGAGHWQSPLIHLPVLALQSLLSYRGF